MDSVRLESLKNKDERAQSAIASQEVREHLAGFLRSKRGSSTQINSLASSSSQQQQQPQQPGGSSGHHPRGAQVLCGGGQSASNSNQDNDDHPLRKTASMPTMHIPYKAQSMSRRRQMERRITMSPLMKRKSRPRRQLLNPLEASGLEYSSNPCILQASGSHSPPPQAGTSGSSHSYNLLRHQTSGGRGGGRARAGGGPLDPMMKSSSQSHLDRQLRMSALGRLIAVDDDLRNPLKTQHMRVQEALRKTVMNRATSRAQLSATGGSLDSAEMSAAKLLEVKRFLEASSPVLSQSGSLSSSKNATTTACELASLTSAPTDATATAPATNSTAAPTKSTPNPVASKKDELRHWSLDGADMRASLNARQAASAAEAAANRTLAWGSLVNREFHRLKLATTSDAASLRQSPISSISLGLSSGSAPAASALHQLQTKAPATSANQPASGQISAKVSDFLSRPMYAQVHAKTRHYSSSSSSTSSLVSAPNSLEDSSSRAIDLSSSSEVARHRQQLHHHNSAGSYSSSRPYQQEASPGRQPPDAALDGELGQQRFNYQKVLQDSFGQLQLCHHQSRDGLKHVLLPSTHSIDITQLEHYRPHQQHPMPGQLTAKAQALSLDIPSSGNLHQRQQQQLAEQFREKQQKIQGEFFGSLTQQFNLSASAQNLLSLQEQQQVHSQLNSFLAHQQHQQDLNHWLMAYNNLIHSAEFQQSHQITSSLLAKITSLPEPFKSSLLSQLLAQHQQAAVAAAAGGGGASSSEGGDTKSIIGRALSSPMLIATDANTGQLEDGRGAGVSAAANDIETPMQAVEFSELNQGGNLKDSNRNARQHMDVHMTTASYGRESFEARACSPSAASDLAASNINNRAQLQSQPVTSLDLSLSSKTKTSIGRDLLAGELLTAAAAAAAQTTNSATEQPAGLNLMLQRQRDFASSKINCNFLYNPAFDRASSTGLVYELELCNHKCICNNENNHPENSFRVLAIWRRLHDSGLMARCARIEGRRATLGELQLCHGETYANYFGRSPYERIKLRQLDLSKLPIEGLTQLECGGQGADIDTAWNEEQTPGVARLAAGCVIEAAVQVASGKLLNAFAVVRPPGHHAEYQQAMGFCFFNSLAIAARVLTTRHQLTRILIVDWDVHHGNGLQKMFYEDKRVMYVSLHRHDRGNFFPGTGDPKEVGLGEGEGYNWNVAWSGEIMGDAEYLAAFRSLVVPLARDFNPSVVLVACGFDGASGHPCNFGGYELSPACFAHMTSQLMSVANGRLVLCLEGGYQLGVICDCAEACVRTLLRGQSQLPRPDLFDQLQESEIKREPNQSARLVLHELSSLAANYWPGVARWRDLIDVSALAAATKTM